MLLHSADSVLRHITEMVCDVDTRRMLGMWTLEALRQVICTLR